MGSKIPASLLWTVSWKTGKQWLVGGSLNYNTVLQLDQFCKKQGKWVEVAYVLPFLSLWDMPDLCPNGIDLGVKTSSLLSSYEREDRRQRDKENRFLQSIPGIICMQRATWEAEEQPHELLPPQEAPTRKNNQSIRVNNPFSYKKYKKSRKIWETIWRTQKNILEPLRVLLSFMILLGRMWCISWGKH